jgi:peptidyl-prolyl cis-trans isomerase D
MTMLDRMRRHKSWLKWSLGLVCLAFVIFYIPDFLRGSGADAASTDTVAIVEGQPIKAEEFRRTYQTQLQAYRSAYGSNMSEQLLKQLGVDQQILQQMVDERAALAEAERLKIRVSDEEVRARILAIPSFQENGAFIGEQRYRDLLQMQSPPISTAEFEESVRRSLVVEKLRATLTDWLSISDKELEQEYRRRNEKVKLAVVTFLTDSFKPDVTASDAEVSSYFEAHKDSFRIPEKRKIRYLLVDVDAIRSKIVVPQADIERAYNENINQYETPEQIRASHILLKTEGKDDAEVKARAEAILTQAKAGADFAELAKKSSEDEGTAPKGGDLDFFGRGKMVPEFDQAAFALKPGQISDLVKTQYGYHIIKLVDKKEGATRSLADVRQQLTDQIAFERAQAQASDLAQSIQKQISKPADLDTAAATRGLQVQESGFFARDEPILALGGSPEVAARAFGMNPGTVSGPIGTSRGFVFLTVVDKRDPYVPKLDEVKDRVRDEVLKQKAREFGHQKAVQLAAALKHAPDFEKAVKAAGFSSQTTELLTRESPIPGLGMAADVIDAAFKLPKGAVSDPIPTEGGTAIVKVLEKQEVTDTEIAANRDRFRGELLADRRNRFYGAYLAKAKQKMKIEVNREVLRKMIGSV